MASRWTGIKFIIKWLVMILKSFIM
jgi:hypothetical protein